MDMTRQFDERDSFAHWFIIASLSGVKITENIKNRPMDVKMQINGEDVNPEKAILRLEEEFDRMVNSKARELLQEWKGDVMEPFEDKIKDMTESLDGLISDKLQRLNIKDEDA